MKHFFLGVFIGLSIFILTGCRLEWRESGEKIDRELRFAEENHEQKTGSIVQPVKLNELHNLKGLKHGSC